LGVVLLLSGPPGAEVAALQRAVGGRPRMAPHLTLVPPVNVRDDRLEEALAVVRTAAAAVAPLALDLGPPATFWPDTPVLYLAVGGDLDGLDRLHRTVGTGPLDRPVDRPFVPHVTLAEDLSPSTIEAAVTALGGYRVAFLAERVHVLEEIAGREWRVVGDAPLGGGRVVGRGGIELELSVGEVVAPDAAELVGAPPFVVTARRGGTAVGLATGRLADDLWLDQLVVDAAARREGIGSQLLAEAELVGARHGCARARVACPPGAEGWFRARGWQPESDEPGTAPVGLVRDLRRWLA
jgi:2'-5' RNA ligase